MIACAVSDLRVELARTGDEIVDGISFVVSRGEVLGMVGESGSGKTTAALALLGHARPGTRIARGAVDIGGIDLLRLSGQELRAARGRLVAHVPQDPATALNPGLRVGRQLTEVIEEHQPREGRIEARARVSQVLEDVRLPTDAAFLRRYPHQLSGGQQQRICLAMAFILRPRMIVLDEPTTGLDVSTQAHVLETVRELCKMYEVGGVYVTHDLSVVANIAQSIVVMYGGRLVEVGSARRVFEHPSHPYTRKLIAAIPDIASRRLLEGIAGGVPAPGQRPEGCVFSPRCLYVVPACREAEPELLKIDEQQFVRCIRAGELDRFEREYRGLANKDAMSSAPVLVVDALGASHGGHTVLRDVSLELRSRECLALVGESGSGKTTLARTLVGLHTERSGEIRFKDMVLPTGIRDRPNEVRRTIQYIFQSPYNSLNPRRTVGEILRVPLAHFFGLSAHAMRTRIESLLTQVALPGSTASRYPDELSGGERQRVAIARSLACEPEVLICDEITSALDVSVQASIVRLLEELQHEAELAILFVTHNLALVRTIAHRVVVLDRGSIVETGVPDELLLRPRHPYTQQLVADTPTLESMRAGAWNAANSPGLQAG